jgi:hypothetical protein
MNFHMDYLQYPIYHMDFWWLLAYGISYNIITLMMKNDIDDICMGDIFPISSIYLHVHMPIFAKYDISLHIRIIGIYVWHMV